MRNQLGLKVAAIAALSVALLLGLVWIGSLVTERQARRDGVIHDIAGSTSEVLGPGLHAPVPAVDGSQLTHVDFQMELGLQGTSQFSVIPVGRASRIKLESDWPNPSFNGAYLPTQRTVTSSGFQARWATSLYAALYGLMGADDYALLLGSVLVFGVLAAVMVLTRDVDWGNLRRTGELAEKE